MLAALKMYAAGQTFVSALGIPRQLLHPLQRQVQPTEDHHRQALTTADVMTAFGAFLRLYVAHGDASPEMIRSYYGKAAQFVAWCREHG